MKRKNIEVDAEGGELNEKVYSREWEEDGDNDNSDLDIDIGVNKSSQRRYNKVKDEYYSSESEHEDFQSTSIIPIQDELLTMEEGDSKLVEEGNNELIRIEPFNMKAEMEEGSFDKESGSFIWKKDEKLHADVWLSEISKEDIERAKIAEEERNIKSQKELESRNKVDPKTIIQKLASFLEFGESPREALQSRKPKQLERRFDNKSKRLAAQQIPVDGTNDEEVKRKREVIEITECCSLLLDFDNFADVYDLTKEELLRKIKS